MLRKIYLYELRRVMLNKSFFGMLAACLFASWQTLQSETILGVAHTAPFSPWSFGSYIARVAPLLMVGLLLMLHSLFSPKAVQINSLTAATPTSPSVYLLIKCSAVATAWLLLAAITAALGIGYLLHAFGDAVRVWSLIAPTVVVLLPALIFVLGLGLLAGHMQSAFIFALMPLVMAADLLPVADGARLLAGSYFSGFPLSLDTLDPAFVLSSDLAAGRLVYLAAGGAFIIIALHKARHLKAIK